MKAVVYHADSHFPWGGKPGVLYEQMFKRFRSYGIPVIHLTCKGFPIWGDEGRHFDLDPHNIVANREEAFTAFLQSAPDDVYWFAEPDFEVLRPIPELEGDLAMLYRREDDVPLTPGWRLARPSALPIFTMIREEMRLDARKDWHGDSAAMTAVWKTLGSPQSNFKYRGIEVELRQFSQYVKPGLFTRNRMGKSKLGVVS